MTLLKRAAGFVIFRYAETVEYLLLQASYAPYHWSPPKGHVEGNEALLETAIRETEEETGISRAHLRIIDLIETIHYNVKGTKKEVTYQLAELVDEIDIYISSEHQNYVWAPLDKACELLEHPDICQILRNCEEYVLAESAAQ